MAEEIKPQDKKEAEAKTEEKKIAKTEPAKITKKDFAETRGYNIGMSTKESIDICNMIRGRTIETALKMLEEVTKFKRVVKMNSREVPHQKGIGVMAGRYPIRACKEFIRLVKQLQANSLVNGLNLDKSIIECRSDFASRPFRRGGARFKRTHVYLKLKSKSKKQ